MRTHSIIALLLLLPVALVSARELGDEARREFDGKVFTLHDGVWVDQAVVAMRGASFDADLVATERDGVWRSWYQQGAIVTKKTLDLGPNVLFVAEDGTLRGAFEDNRARNRALQRGLAGTLADLGLGAAGAAPPPPPPVAPAQPVAPPPPPPPADEPAPTTAVRTPPQPRAEPREPMRDLAPPSAAIERPAGPAFAYDPGIDHDAYGFEIMSWYGEISIDGETVPGMQSGGGARIFVREGATLVTGEEGNLFGRYTSDGSQLRVKEDSVVVMIAFEPQGDQVHRVIDLQAGSAEYLADPSATVTMRIETIRGAAFTRDADLAVRVDAYEGAHELSCVICHNIDHTTDVKGRPDTVMSILKEDVEVTGRAAATMNPGSVLILCPRLRRTINETTRHAVENSSDAVPVTEIEEASPFGRVQIFDF
jgi:hypothetical protein